MVKFLFLNYLPELLVLFLPFFLLFFTTWSLSPLYIIFITGVVIASYRLFIRANRFFYKVLTLVLAHTLFLAPIIFVFIAAMGGASMAVVEGVAGSVLVRYTGYVLHTTYVLGYFQIFIIPWSCFSIFLLKKTANTKVSKVVFLSLAGIVLVYIILTCGSRILFN